MDIPGIENAISEIKKVLVDNPDVKNDAWALPRLYVGKRGLMVVDVVASRQRMYEKYVKPTLLPTYERKAKDLSLASLSETAPTWMKLRNGEAVVMMEVAQHILGYGETIGTTTEDELCKVWADDIKFSSQVLDIKGIGPALYQYLRMLCGADTLKSDLRVKRGLEKLGLPVNWFTDDGVLELCKVLAKGAECSMVELDQCLYKVIGSTKD